MRWRRQDGILADGLAAWDNWLKGAADLSRASCVPESAMNTMLVYVAAATLGFQVGWQRLPEGGMQYIIQLDPQTLDALRDGQPIQSDIPSDAGEIRSYRIVMGAGMSKPPREAPPPPAPVTPAPVEPAKPWLPLTLTLLGLFASLGANAFLGWIAWGFRRRCQSAA